MSTVPPEWDLRPLLGGRRDADVLLEEADRAVVGVERHRGRVSTLDGDGLSALMTAIGGIYELTGRAQAYAELRYAADTSDSDAASLLQWVLDCVDALEGRLAFFLVEWSNLPDDLAARLLGHPGLSFCRHHLTRARRRRPHLLSEPEERILAEKESTGREAWIRLFGALGARVEVGCGGGRTSVEEALGTLSSAASAERLAAARGLSEAIAPELPVRAFTLEAVVHDKAVEDRLRHFDHWLASRNLENDLSDESVRSLVSAVRGRYDVPRRWYRLKARLLGIDRLADHDRVAAVGDDGERLSWADAVELVVGAYSSVDPRLGGMVRRFFDERWVDASARPGKRPGAFCAYTVPSANPYCLLTYSGRARDVLHLGHELGHGLHALLAAPQGIFHQSPTLPLAETGSILGEMLVLDRLLGRVATPDGRLSVLARSVDEMVSNVFMQVSLHSFEDRVHEHFRGGRSLDAPELSRLWTSTQAEMFGDAVEITDGFRSWWSLVTHFVAAPGYLYSYAYGQLVAMALYAKVGQDPPGFSGPLLQMLARGGGAPPEEVVGTAGIDLTDPRFWNEGLSVIDSRIDDVERAAVEAGRL